LAITNHINAKNQKIVDAYNDVKAKAGITTNDANVIGDYLGSAADAEAQELQNKFNAFFQSYRSFYRLAA
jgi:hypothetical protein